MALTANNNWPVPVATDLVRNGWQAINDLGVAIDASLNKATYTTFTPSITGTSSGWTLGGGSAATGRWCQLGKTAFVDGTITLGSSPSAGSNAFAVALPVNANTNTSEWTGTGWYYDDSANDLYPCYLKISGTKLEFYLQKRSSTSGGTLDYVRAIAFDTTNKPVTPASGDVFGFSITYQVA